MMAPPRPVPVTRPAATPASIGDMPGDWSAIDASAAQRHLVGAMIAAARRAHSHHRWCHEIDRIQLAGLPHTIDTGAPELMTAWRHMQSLENSSVPAAGCFVAAPALVGLSHQIVDADESHAEMAR